MTREDAVLMTNALTVLVVHRHEYQTKNVSSA